MPTPHQTLTELWYLSVSRRRRLFSELHPGGACVAAAKKLLSSGFLKKEDRVVLFNTGTGLKYLEAYSTRFPRVAESEQDKLGGLILPR